MSTPISRLQYLVEKQGGLKQSDTPTQKKYTPIANVAQHAINKVDNIEKDIQQQNRIKAIEREKGVKTAEIEEVYFNMFSTEEIDRRSVKTITSSEHDDTHGVRSPSLGPRNRSQICDTCSKDFRACPGHFGKIIIPPLLHPLCISWILDILSIICPACGMLQLTKEQMDAEKISHLNGSVRLKRIREVVKRLGKQVTRCNRTIVLGDQLVRCSGTATPVFASVKENKESYNIRYTYPGNSEIMLMSPLEIKNIFDLISNEDAKLMGFINGSHPRNLIMERLIVIPYCARPDMYQGEQMLQDDLTIIYTEIVTWVNNYFNVNGNESSKKDALEKIHNKIGHMMFNHDSSYQQNHKVLMDLKKRLQGKKALIRGNIMGKRVNFAGRTVASSGANQRVDQITIPKSMASELTLPIHATKYNLSLLQQFYDSGQVRHIYMLNDSSASRRTVGELFYKKFPNYKIQIGDIVGRDLQNGDKVIVNRQPTLHKQSMIGLYVILGDDKVVRINLSNTTPLNADFDGDELNIHLPQTIEAYAEVENILLVNRILTNDQKNNLMIGITYESLVGAYMVTMHTEFLTILNQEQIAVPPPDAATLSDIHKKRNILMNEKLLPENIFRIIMQPLMTLPQYATLSQRLAEYDIKWGTVRSLFSAMLPSQINFSDKNFDIRNGIILKANIGSDILFPTPIDGFLNSEQYFIRFFPQELQYNNPEFFSVQMNKNTLSASLLEGGLMNETVFFSALNRIAGRSELLTLRERLKKHGIPWLSHRALFSACLPETFYYKAKHENDSMKITNEILIKDGVLIRGIIDKELIGPGKGYLNLQMLKQLGGKTVIDYMSNLQFIVIEYMALTGFTIGLSDCIPSDESYRIQIDKSIDEMAKKVILLQDYSALDFEAERRETKIDELVKNVKTNSDNILRKFIELLNPIRVMAESGAKGAVFNAVQISAMMGQQSVGNQRIPANLIGNRSLPVFEPGDKTPYSRGFVKNSFATGLDPHEFFFAAQGGREGLVDTSINTAQTGFLEHQLVKFLEDITTDSMGGVRAVGDTIIDFVYGGDGFEAGHLYNVKIDGQTMPFFMDLQQFAGMLNNKYSL